MDFLASYSCSLSRIQNFYSDFASFKSVKSDAFSLFFVVWMGQLGLNCAVESLLIGRVGLVVLYLTHL